jgi:integrase
MATARILLDQRNHCQANDGSFPLVLRIGHNRQNRDIPLGIHALPKKYDPETRKLTGITNSVRHTKRIQKKYGDIDLWLDEEGETIKHWDINHLKSEIEKRFFEKQLSLTLLSYSAVYLRRLQLEKRFSTARSYEDALKKFIKYRLRNAGKSDEAQIKSLFTLKDGELSVRDEYKIYDLAIKAIDANFAKDFKAYMGSTMKSRNSVGIYLRSLQAIINDAGGSFTELKDHRPLDNIKKTSTRNKPVDLTIAEIDAIRNLSFKEDSPLFHARNYFLFMFNNMGMNFFDLALLKTFQFDGEEIHYIRKKTESEGDHFSIKQNQEALSIINQYLDGQQKDDYLFPIIPPGTPPERIYRVKNDKIGWLNKHLKKIAELACIDKKITSYTARDTWTNIGLNLGIDIREISSGLGHSSVEVTDKHYGQTVKQKVLEKINSKITGVKSS